MDEMALQEFLSHLERIGNELGRLNAIMEDIAGSWRQFIAAMEAEDGH